jgi:hypothetical protein
VLLLAIQPLRVLGARLTGVAIGCVVALAVVCVLLASVMRRGWAWHAAFGVQAALLASGVFHLALAVLGVLFLAVWCYVFGIRRTVLGREG